MLHSGALKKGGVAAWLRPFTQRTYLTWRTGSISGRERPPGQGLSPVRRTGRRAMPDPSTQVPAPEQTQDPTPRRPRSPHSGPSSPFPQRCGHWSSKPHPVPDPGPSGLGPRGTPGVVVLRPVQDHVARDRQAPPSLCISGNVVSQGHCGPRSRISREWDRGGRGGGPSLAGICGLSPVELAREQKPVPRCPRVP